MTNVDPEMLLAYTLGQVQSEQLYSEPELECTETCNVLPFVVASGAARDSPCRTIRY